MRLNEITILIENKSHLTPENESLVKEIFKEINENGERYDVDEIESWFENEGSWNNKDVRTRIVNISHYAQSKFEQTNKFRIVDDSCGDGDSCSCGH
tara:strand:+ start:386 stop:676 length:291 start_codon:yes stop_codon:yes gene_type:complete